MKTGDRIPLERIHADQHFTQPPPRFTEAALVKALEEYGIGRPSTYASIIQTLLFRKYVEMESRSFRPSDVGRAVSKFLSGHFTQYVDYDFTAKLEDELDAVSRGEEEWVPLMERFWAPFKQLVDEKTESVDRSEASGARELGTDPKTGKPVSVRLGRYGPYAAIGSTAEDEAEKPTFASLRPGQSMHTISLADALELFKLPRKLGQSKGEELTVGIGRFGAFAKRGSVYASLKKEDDPYTIDLARAEALLEEKEETARNRIIKSFDDCDIQVLNGRYGPYISDGKLNGRIPKDREPASLTREEVIKLLEETGKPMRGRFGKKVAKKAPAKKAVAKAPAKTVVAKKATAKKTVQEVGEKEAGEKSREEDREKDRRGCEESDQEDGRRRHTQGHAGGRRRAVLTHASPRRAKLRHACLVDPGRRRRPASAAASSPTRPKRCGAWAAIRSMKPRSCACWRSSSARSPKA